MRTAREYPTTGSHFVPLEKFCRVTAISVLLVPGCPVPGSLVNPHLCCIAARRDQWKNAPASAPAPAHDHRDQLAPDSLPCSGPAFVLPAAQSRSTLLMTDVFLALQSRAQPAARSIPRNC